MTHALHTNMVRLCRLLPVVALIALIPSAYAEKVGTVTHLKNGMKVVLREDHSSPLVAAFIVVGAGSRYEDDQTSGMSHLLEHLLFDGTTTRTQAQIKETYDYYGGYANAMTREDYTAFLITMPSQYIEQGLDVQADMLLNSVFTDEQLAKERKVVIEEMTRDNANTRTSDSTRFAEIAFAGTPYNRPIIGYQKNIETVEKDRIYDYYKAHYIPSNMTAMIVGDFDPEKITAMLDRLYGSVPAGAFTRPSTDRNRYAEAKVEQRETGTASPYVMLALSAPLLSDPDAPAFEVLTSILFNGETDWDAIGLTAGDAASATYVAGSYDSYRDAAALDLTIGLKDLAQADAALAALRTALADIAGKGPTDDQLRRAKLGIRADVVFSTQSFMYEAMDLCRWEGTIGYERRNPYYEQVQKATGDDIRRVAAKWIIGANAVGVVFTPKPGAQESPGGGMPTMPPRHADLSPFILHPSSFILSPASAVAKRTIDNGLTLIAKCDPNAEVTAVHVLIRHRIQLEQPGKNGVGYVTQRLLDRGTTTRTKDQIAGDIADIAARIKVVDDPSLPFDDYYNSKDYAFIRFEVLDEYRDKGLAVLADMVTAPSFPEADLVDVKAGAIQAARGAAKSASQGAGVAFTEALYKEGSPFRGSIIGSEATLTTITRQDVLDYYHRAYAPNNLIISIVSPLPTDRALDKLSSLFGSMQRVEGIAIVDPGITDISAPIEKHVNINADQGVVAWGVRLPGAGDPDMPALTLMNEILSSRLAQQLREKQGLAYSVGSSADFLQSFGTLSASMGTRNENIETAKTGMLDVIRDLKTSAPTDRELTTSANGYWGHLLRFRQSAINQAYYLGYYEHLGLGYDYDQRQFDLLKSVTRDDIIRVAGRYLNTDHSVVVTASRP